VAVLESLLQAEGIRYFLRNTGSAGVYSPVIPLILEVAEDDVEDAVNLIKESGFERYLL
jgi:hypothetical protein